jgi:hypothetical protein
MASHQSDVNYYGRTGRVNPVLRGHVGIMLVSLGLCFGLVGLLSILSGTVSVPLIVAGALLLAAGIGVLHWRSRRGRTGSALQHHNRRKKAHH